MYSYLLPVGTVIKLYNNKNKYIILGTFCEIDGNEYTYYCCKYPYGLILDNGEINKKITKYDIYINQADIEKIFFLGNLNNEG